MAAVTLFTVVVKEGGLAKLTEVLLIVVIGGKPPCSVTAHTANPVAQLLSAISFAIPFGRNPQPPGFRNRFPQQSIHTVRCSVY